MEANHQSLDITTLPKLPMIARDAHKNVRGHALIIAGSREKSGASILSSIAAMRSGVGLTTLALPSVAHDLIKSQLINVMSEILPSNKKSVFTPAAFVKTRGLLQKKTALLVGPGLAPDRNRNRWIKQILQKLEVPLVMDAQVLTDLGPSISNLRIRKQKVVITPHPGEMSRLTGISTDEIQKNRNEVARKFSKHWNVTVILKGANTIIAFPSGTTWINQVDHPCLSVAGTGDVLAGILVSLLAQNIIVEDACKLAVYIHGRAGQRLGHTIGIRGVVASDLFNEIPQVLHEIDQNTAA